MKEAGVVLVQARPGPLLVVLAQGGGSVFWKANYGQNSTETDGQTQQPRETPSRTTTTTTTAAR